MRVIVFLLHRKKVIAGGDVPEILKGLFFVPRIAL